MVISSRPNKTLFLSETWYGVRFVSLLIVAVIIMLADTHSQHFMRYRAGLTTLMVPILHVAKWPSDMVAWVAQGLASQQQLNAENTALKSQLLMSNAKLQRLLSLEKENRDLRSLLQSSQRLAEQSLAAQLLAVNPSPFVQQITLDQGALQAVNIGFVVLDASGVMGQVISTSPYSSEVLLITDVRSAIPIQNARTAMRAIAVGQGAHELLALQHVPKNSDIRPGDSIVTSGLGQRFPAGYPVGTVVAVNHKSGDLFADITVKPAAHLRRSRQFLIIRAVK